MKENSKILLKESASGKTWLSAKPAALHLETVRGCHSACCMCEVPHDSSPPVKMPPSLLKKIEPYFADLEYLCVHGLGEPLLGNLDYFVCQAIRHDFVCHMNSTGFHLTPAVTDLLLKAKLSIRFSIHAGRPATYRKIMGKDFEHVIPRIAHLIKESKRRGKNDEFWFCFVVMKENIDEIPDILQLAHDCGVTTVRFSPLAPNRFTVRGIFFKKRNFRFLFREQWNKHVHQKFLNRYALYQEQAQSLNIKLECDKLLSYSNLLNPHPRLYYLWQYLYAPRKKPSCLAPWLGQFNININGEVQLCCSSPKVIGHLRESSLDELWNNPMMQDIRKTFARARYPFVCGSCRGYGFSNLPQNTPLAQDKSSLPPNCPTSSSELVAAFPAN